VLNLDCNLISVGQLVDEICCMVTFFKKHCMVQDLTSKKLIGVDELHRGVFAFKEDSEINFQANKVVSYNLWHQRMGHPSCQALYKVFSNIELDISKNKNISCDVCLQAKQSHAPFPPSNI